MRPYTGFILLFFHLFIYVNSFAQEQSYALGMDLICKGKYRDAIEDANREMKKGNLDKYELGKLHINLGRCYQYLMAYDSAFYNFQKANSLFQDVNHFSGLAEGHIWLLEYYRATSNLHQIRKTDVLCERYLAKIPKDTLLNALHLNRRGAFINQFYEDSTDRAAELVKQSLRLVEGSTAKYANYVRGNGYLDLGMNFERKGDQQCFEWYKKSFELWSKIGNTHYANYSLMNLAQANVVFKKYKDALSYALQSLNIAKEEGLLDTQRRSYYLLYQIYDGMGDCEKALDALRGYHTTNFFSIPLEHYQLMLEAEKNYEEERKQKEVELNEAKLELSNQIVTRAKTERDVFAVLMTVFIVSLVAALVVYMKIRRDKKELQKALEFNRVLLKEVNHRVKNNLTFLKSLLYLKEKYVEEPTTKRILLEFQNRIQAMAIVHTELYNLNNDNSDVDLISVLLKNLNEFQNIQQYKGRKVDFEVTGTVPNMSLEKSMPIMLILNELVTNSVKFVDDVELKVKIHFQMQQNELHLSYWDSGIGLSQEMLENSNGFGLRMVRLMMKQLNGVIRFEASTIILMIEL